MYRHPLSFTHLFFAPWYLNAPAGVFVDKFPPITVGIVVNTGVMPCWRHNARNFSVALSHEGLGVVLYFEVLLSLSFMPRHHTAISGFATCNRFSKSSIMAFDLAPEKALNRMRFCLSCGSQ